MRRILASIIVLLSLPIPVAFAGPFFDVPDDHPYVKAFTELKSLGVMTGDKNPDGSLKGTVRPYDPLNRAELMALVYRAAGRIARAVLEGCREDVPLGKWFSAIICDAIAQGYVQGYPDGFFRPENTVNAVEGIKMILRVLGFTVPELSQEDRLSLDFLGVTHGSWYAPFLHRAISLQIVPEELMKDNVFIPEKPLLRGIAAEMIYRALNTDDLLETEDVPRTVREAPKEEVTPTGATLVAFPLHRTGKTGERGAASYAFDLDSAGTILVEATNLRSLDAEISCFLYLLRESGFSSEFFVGYEEGASCFIRASLRPGRYQLEVRTPVTGEEFSLDAEPSSGDGNDGFFDAIALRVGVPRKGALPAHDYEDWFRFTVTGIQSRRVQLSSGSPLPCTIYPWEDVDLFGEQGPECGSAFEFQPGTYFVSVKRSPPSSAAHAYTLELR